MKECPRALGPLCMHVRNGTTHPVKWTARSSGTALGMMIMVTRIFVWSLYVVIEVCSMKSREARYLIHEIIPRRHRQGVIRIKMIVVIARRTRHWLLAGTCWRQQLGIHQPVSITNNAPSSSRSKIHGCKDRPNDWYHDSLLVSGDRPSLLR